MTAVAQSPRLYTAQDYARAERLLSYNVNPLTYQGVVHAHWLPDGRFWYRDFTASGWSYIVVDPVQKTKTAAFDHARMATALSQSADHLKISEIEFQSGGLISITVDGKHLQCDLSGLASCKEVAHKGGKEPGTLSPDKKKEAFIREYNLWVRDLASGQETQLTTDGVKDYGYATDNAGWKQSDRAILVWSPDSKRIATFQQDQRKTGEMYLVPVTNSHPTLKAWKYPLVGDKDITMIERVIIDVDQPKVIRLKMPPDQHRSTLCDDIACAGTTWDDVEWSDDSNHLAFVSTSRDHKQEWLRVTDAEIGQIREVMNETVPKFFESGNGKVNWKYFPKSNEILWFSERDNWGQLYLYDLTTGQLKNQITHGDGNVTQVLRVDEQTRTICFLAVGKEPGRDPYFSHLYSIGFDAGTCTCSRPKTRITR